MAKKQLKETLSLDREAFKEKALNELKNVDKYHKARVITECLDHFIRARRWVDRINLDDIECMITQSNEDDTTLVESVISKVCPRTMAKKLNEGSNASDWDLMRKARDFTQEEVLKALKGVVSTKTYNDIKNDYKIAKLRQLTKSEQEKVAKKLEKKDIKESLEKPLTESVSLLEGTSNFGSLDNFPLLVYIPYDEFYDSLEYVDGYPKMEDYDNEDDYYEAQEKFVDEYYDKHYKGVALLTDEDVANLESDIEDFNRQTKDIAYDLDNYDLEDIQLKLEPGYYEGVQIDCEYEKSFNYLDEKVKEEQLARFKKFFDDIKTKYGLTSLSVAYRFSNGETGYKIEEELDEKVQLNEEGDKTTFGLSTGNTPILDAGLYYSFLGELVPSRADEPERFKEFEDCVMEKAKPILDELVKKSGDFEVVSVDAYYHPKYYNYETDELDFTVKYTGNELGTVIETYANNLDFIEFLKNYSSYDGFISNFADTKEDFETQDYGKSVAQILKYNVSQEEYERANEQLYYDVMDCGFYPEDEDDDVEESLEEASKRGNKFMYRIYMKNRDKDYASGKDYKDAKSMLTDAKKDFELATKELRTNPNELVCKLYAFVDDDYYNYKDLRSLKDIEGEIELNDKYANESIEEGYHDYMDRDYADYLGKDVDVYDVKQFVENETENKYRTHYTDKYAIIVCDNGKGCVVDYEAVGQDFDNIDDKISFGVEENKDNEYTDEQGNKHYTINVMATHRLNTTPRDLIENAPKETMKMRDFFRKYKYNDRCSHNFRDLIKYINMNNKSTKASKEENLEEASEGKKVTIKNEGAKTYTSKEDIKRINDELGRKARMGKLVPIHMGDDKLELSEPAINGIWTIFLNEKGFITKITLF